MDDLLFLSDPISGNAKLTITSPHRADVTIRRLNLDIIASKAPKFAKAFTCKSEDEFRLQLSEFSSSAIIGLLRYCYLGDYVLCEALYEKPCSLLLHFQLFRLSEIYDIPELKDLAYTHCFRETELTISTGKPVMDLCDAIRFMYLELRSHSNLREVVAHYCLSCYLSHGLHNSESFRQTVYESPLFHRDLSRANLRAHFKDPGAAEIFALATCTHIAHLSADQDLQIAADFMCCFHTSEYNPLTAKQKHLDIWREPMVDTFVLIEHPDRISTTQGTGLSAEQPNVLQHERRAVETKTKKNVSFADEPPKPRPLTVLRYDELNEVDELLDPVRSPSLSPEMAFEEEEFFPTQVPQSRPIALPFRTRSWHEQISKVAQDSDAFGPCSTEPSSLEVTEQTSSAFDGQPLRSKTQQNSSGSSISSDEIDLVHDLDMTSAESLDEFEWVDLFEES